MSDGSQTVNGVRELKNKLVNKCRFIMRKKRHIKVLASDYNQWYISGHTGSVTLHISRLWGFQKQEVWSTSWVHLLMIQWFDVNDT